MAYHIIPPDNDLKDYVSHFWTHRWEAGIQTEFTYYSTANVLTEWVFAFKTSKNGYDEMVFSSAMGHTEHFSSVPASGFSHMFGVAVYSYALPCLFRISPAEIKGELLDISELIHRNADTLTGRVTHTSTTRDRVAIISDYFRASLTTPFKEDRMIIHAVKKIINTRGVVNIADLAGAYGLSQKQFDRRFKAYSGFNPKLYSRILRFESALGRRREYATLTDLAHAHGYYDQAHFIHDFKDFSGYSPNQFFSLAGY